MVLLNQTGFDSFVWAVLTETQIKSLAAEIWLLLVPVYLALEKEEPVPLLF